MTMKHMNTAPSTNPRLGAHRRGIALMLVMIALVVTTILVGAALTTRENSAAIAENAVTSVEAVWSAESAANFAVGAIAQSSDLDALLGGDAMMSDDLTVFGESVKVSVTNLAGDPATDADRELIVIATSESGGIEKVVRKRVTRNVGGDLAGAVDPFLNEFAIYALDSLIVQSNTKIGVWALSPETASSAIAKIGVGFSNSADLSIDLSAVLERTGLYCDERATIGLETAMSNLGASRYWLIPLTVPVAGAGAPNGFDSLPALGSDIDMDGLNSALATPAHYGELRVRNNGKLVIDEANGNMYCCDRLRIENGGVVEIRGNIHLKVEDEIDLDDGVLALYDNASVTLYIGGDVRVENRAKLGVSMADASSGATVVSDYVGPSRVKMLALDPSAGGSAAPTWVIQSQGVVAGCLHNPNGSVSLDAGTAVFGRVTAGTMTMYSSSRLLYCPVLDSRQGFSEPTSPIYDVDGEPVDGLLDVIDTTLNTPILEDLYADDLVSELDSAFIELGGGSQSSSGTQSKTILDLPGIIRF